MFRYFSKSVVRLFNSIILTLVTLGLTAFGVLIGYYNYNQTITDLASKSQNTVELAAISLQGPIWNFDEEGSADIVKAIFLDKDIKAIQILSADGEEMAAEKLGIAETLSFEEMAADENLIVKQGQVMREGEKIGVVTVVSSTERAIQLIQQTSILIAIFSASLITVMIGFIWMTGRKVIQKPIGALQASAIELASGNLETNINTERGDELGALAKSFDSMRCSIRKKIVDLNILNQTGEKLASTHDQIEAMKTSLRIMNEQANVQRGSIYLLQDDQLKLYACYPEIEEAGEAKHFSLGEGIAGQCAREQSIQFIGNTQDSDKYVHTPGETAAALLCVPMMDGSEVFGVMNFSGAIDQVTFTESEHDFSLTLARMAVNSIKNIQMLEIIQEQNRTLEHKVQERTSELRQKSNDISNMLQNMRQGIFTITSALTVHGEYSAFLEDIFERKDLADMKASSLLFDNSDLGSDILNQNQAALEAIIGEDMMMFDCNGHILAREYSMTMGNDHHKILELDWNPISNEDDEVEKLMVTVRDVTELRGLQAEAEKQKTELDTIGQILSVSQKKFLGFLKSANDFVVENRSLIESSNEKDLSVIATLFRNMHTIKGNARTYGFTYLTDIVHVAETTYDVLRKNDDAVWDKDQLLDELKQVEGKVAIYQSIFDQKLAGFSGGGDGTFIEKGLLAAIDHAVHDADDVLHDGHEHELSEIEQIVSHMKSVLDAIGTETMVSTLETILTSVPKMASDLGKEVPEVVLEDNGIRFAEDIVPVLKDVFMHVFRNSMDHGLEPAEERVAAGKTEHGKITLDAQHEDGNLVFHFYDDGRGLALSYIHKKAVANGLVGESEDISDEDLAQFIFHSGLSTAASVTMVSGRGVGMDAVKQFLRKHGGDIEIRFMGERTEAGYRPFEQIVTLPIGTSVKVAVAKAA